MRLDLFLKLSRLVKRRSVAAEMIQASAVRVNGRSVKPAADVKIGDRIAVAFPFRLVEAQVLCADEAMLRRKGTEATKILSERRISPELNPWGEGAVSTQEGSL